MNPHTLSRRRLLTVAGASAVGVMVNDPAKAQAAVANAPRLPMSILLRGNLDDPFQQRISEISPRITVGKDVPIAEAHVILGSIGAEDVAKAKELRWVQWPSAGVEHAPLEMFIERDIILTNAQGCYGPQIAEHVFGLLFALTRSIGNQARARKWTHGGEQIELRGLTMGIIGLGGIGRETARRAKAMDMKVIAVDAEPLLVEKFAIVDECRLVDDGLDDLLKRSDVVVVAAPLTPKSHGMLGPDQFAAMKPGAYLINVSRGKLVKTDAMLAALRGGRLAGVGLDVTDPEPLPPDHPLWQEDNAIITAHIAGRSQLGYDRVQRLFVENVARYIAARPMLNLVDKRKGY